MSHNIFKDNFIKSSARTGLLLVVVAIVTLEATALLQMYFSQKSIKKEASLRAQSQMEASRNQIMDIINQAESAVRNSVWIAQWALSHPDSIYRVSQRIVQNNPVVMGSTMALIPGYNRKHPLFSPYVCRQGEGVEFLSLATPEYDYPSKEWFTKPLELGEGYWSEPYIDTGGGDILMTTFSLPIRDKDGRFAAVLTADVSLDWLTGLVGNIQVYPSAFSMMISRKGQIMVCPDETLVMKQSVDQVIARLDDTTGFGNLNKAMLAGEYGNMPVDLYGVTSVVYFAPVERTGWSMSIVIPEKEIYGELRRLGLIVALFQLLGIVMLILILRSFIKKQHEYNELENRRQRFQGELHVASSIQMSMIPKVPPFSERHDLDMAAVIIPAKEVAGDLYDFYIRDGKLYFCIGDVSGKGIPASLVMAVTRTMFRAVSAHEDDPGRIVSLMNDGLTDANDNNMFVTLFCGVLDLSTGKMSYSNAGHNPPMILTDEIRMLPVWSNLPLGILPGQEYPVQEITLEADDALFLYTDGVTEAENIAHEQFGEERTIQALRARGSSDDHLRTVGDAVSVFVGQAPQSDDLTMPFIHYLGAETAHRIILENNVKQLSRLAGWAANIGAEAGLDEASISGINLALEEAAANVVNYAYPEGETGIIELEADITPAGITFTMSDRGKPFDPTAAPDADINASVEDRPIGGLGIHMVRTLMDSVSYQYKDGKNILKMTKNIK